MSQVGEKAIKKIKKNMPDEAEVLAAEIRNKLSLAYVISAELKEEIITESKEEMSKYLEDSLNEIRDIAKKLSKWIS